MTCLLCDTDAPSTVVNTIARHNTPQRMVACSRCTFVQQDPMPSADEVRAYYESGAYRRDFPLPDPERASIIAGGTAEWLRERVRITDEDRILEIGCGDGRVAMLLGADGVEIDPALWAEAHEIRNVGRDTWDAYTLVLALQVLEHQPDPVATLREWRSYLAPGGRIHIQVPTLEAMYGGASYWFQAPHLVAFTQRTLRIALYMAGYSEVEAGIDGRVLWATAYASSVSERGYGEAVYCAGATPIDDAPALIATHEAEHAKTQPSAVERWLGDPDAPRPSDAALRHALGVLASVASAGMDGAARISLQAGAALEAGDDAWSLDPWVLGFQAGAAATHQRYQQANAHLANALRVRASK